jgi:hypothetical protein
MSPAPKQSDVFYPSPFLSEISPPGQQVSGGLTALEKSSIGIGILVFLCLLTIVSVLLCRKRGVAAARVNRSLEYSDRDSDYSGDDRIHESLVDVGKFTGKSVWSESESESAEPSI